MPQLIENAARALLDGYAGGPVEPVRGRFAAHDVEAAYAVQQAQVHHWLAAGRRPVGRKIGLTSPAVQRQLGVGEPDFGQLFADMVYGSGERIPMDALQQPRVEAEIALILGEDLGMPHPTVADVVAATAWVLPAVEVVCSRIAGWDIDIVDTIADNASSGAVVIGGPARRIEGLDLAGCRMRMTRRSELVARGVGADCMGGPLNAAAWLARRAVALGRPLAAGEIVLTGALGPMVPVQAHDVFEAEIDGIGSVSVGFEGPSRPRRPHPIVLQELRHDR